MEGTLHLTAAAQETFGADAWIACIAHLGTDAAEAIDGDTWIGLLAYLATNANETVHAEAAIGAIIAMRAGIYEIFSASASVDVIDTYQTILDVTLPPGGKLVIDSDNLIVLLDGENALHLHAGDWVYLSRGTLDVEVDSGSAATLDCNILYTERWL